MKDNVKKCFVEEWNARNVKKKHYAIIDFDILNAMASRNYQYLLHEIQHNPDYDESTFYITKNAVSGAIGSIGGIVGALSLATPVGIIAGIGISLFAAAMSLYFDFEGPSAKVSAIWDQMKTHVEEYVVEKFEQQEYIDLKAELDGCAAVFDLYVNYLKKGQSYGPAAETNCRAAIIAIAQAIPKFQKEKYKVLALPFYVLAVELEILLYRDLVIFGKSWGVSEKDQATDKKMLKAQISKSVQYAHETYLLGLKERKEKQYPKDISTCCQIEINPEHRSLTYTWNYINQYKQGMQLYVLDIIAQFPTLDPTNYSLGTNIKQSREIYSKIAGALIVDEYEDRWANPDPNRERIYMVSDIDVKLQKKYIGELIDIQMADTTWLPPGGSKATDIITRVESTVDQLTAVAKQKEYKNRYYSPSGHSQYDMKFPLSHISPFKTIEACCNVRDKYAAHGLVTSFLGKDSNGNLYPPPPDAPELTCSLNPENHKLSSLHLFGVYDAKSQRGQKEISSGLICGFRQIDLHPKHTISRNLITQIPAEMTADKGFKDFQVIPEDITGQNVMKARKSGAYLLYDIFGLENTTYHGKVRLYLCFKGSLNYTSKILIKQIEKDKNGKPIETELGSLTLSSTTANNENVKGKNGYFALTGSIPITLKEGRSQIKFVHDSNYNLHELFIDRVEIIPEKVETTISGQEGAISLTVGSDGVLKATVVKAGFLDKRNSSKKWKVFVSGQDTGFEFLGGMGTEYQVITFNQKFSGTVSKFKIPGNTLNVLEFTKSPLPITEITITKNGETKPILLLGSVYDENQNQLIMQKANNVSDTDLEQKIEKDYSIFVGAELVYQCKKDFGIKFKTIMDVFNALGIRATFATVLEGNAVIDLRDAASQMIANLFLPKEMGKTLKPNVCGYDLRVAKNLLRACKIKGLGLPSGSIADLNEAEKIVFGKTVTTEENLDTIVP